MGRLGVPTFVCDGCTRVSPLHMSNSISIRGRHWRVESRWRRDHLNAWHVSAWIACSQECAVAIAEREKRAYGQQLPKLTFAVHGPYTPNDSA